MGLRGGDKLARYHHMRGVEQDEAEKRVGGIKAKSHAKRAAQDRAQRLGFGRHVRGKPFHQLSGAAINQACDDYLSREGRLRKTSRSLVRVRVSA